MNHPPRSPALYISGLTRGEWALDEQPSDRGWAFLHAAVEKEVDVAFGSVRVMNRGGADAHFRRAIATPYGQRMRRREP